jgi:hypothetical protein
MEDTSEHFYEHIIVYLSPACNENAQKITPQGYALWGKKAIN